MRQRTQLGVPRLHRLELYQEMVALEPERLESLRLRTSDGEVGDQSERENADCRDEASRSARDFILHGAAPA